MFPKRYFNGLNVYKLAKNQSVADRLERLGFVCVDDNKGGLQVNSGQNSRKSKAVTEANAEPESKIRRGRPKKGEERPKPEEKPTGKPANGIPEFVWSSDNPLVWRGKLLSQLQKKHELVDYFNEVGLPHPVRADGKPPVINDYKAELAKYVSRIRREVKRRNEIKKRKGK